MQAKQSRTLQAFERVQDFLANNAAILGTIPQSAPAAALNAVVTALSSNASDQGTAKIQTKGATSSQAQLRRVLIVTHMRPIAAIAKDQANAIPSVTGLIMPKPKVNVTQLVADAGSMADAATPFAQTFVDNGLPADFIAQLQAAAAALNGAAKLKGTSKTNSVKATTGLVAQQRQGRSSLTILNTLVQSALAGQTDSLAQWANAKRITPQRASGTTPVTPPPAPATPSAQTVPSTPSTTEVKAA